MIREQTLKRFRFRGAKEDRAGLQGKLLKGFLVYATIQKDYDPKRERKNQNLWAFPSLMVRNGFPVEIVPRQRGLEPETERADRWIRDEAEDCGRGLAPCAVVAFERKRSRQAQKRSSRGNGF